MKPEELKAIVIAVLYAGNQITTAIRSAASSGGAFQPSSTEDIGKRATAILKEAQKTY